MAIELRLQVKMWLPLDSNACEYISEAPDSSLSLLTDENLGAIRQLWAKFWSKSYVHTEVVLLIPFYRWEKNAAWGAWVTCTRAHSWWAHTVTLQTSEQSLLCSGFSEAETFQNPTAPPHANSSSDLPCLLHLLLYVAALSLSKV